MFGVPIEIKVDGEPEIIYLATRRVGEANAAMAAAKKVLYPTKMQLAGLTHRVAALTVKTQKFNYKGSNADERLEELSVQMTSATELVGALQLQMYAQAEVIVRESLIENYGEKQADKYMQCFSDQQMVALVSAIECGEAPADFFPSSEREKSETSTQRPVAISAGSSSKKGTRKGRSKKAK